MSNGHLKTEASSATGAYVISSPSLAQATGVDLAVPAKSTASTTHTLSKNLVNAVYAHIQALRALGHTRINTADIADALSLSRRDVEAAISTLKGKGIRVIK